MKKISVIIPVFSTPAWAEICLNSINRSSIRNDVEVVAVLNTTDATTIESVKSKYPDKIIHLDKNAGTAGGFNAGALESTSDILCFIHTDTFVSSKTIEELLGRFTELHEGNKNIVGVMPCTNYAVEQVLVSDISLKDDYVKYKPSTKSIPTIEQINKFVMDFYGNKNNCLDAIDIYANKIKSENNGIHLQLPEISHYCLMVNKDSFIDNGMFDVDFFPNGYFEKLFLSKLHKRNLEIHLCKDIYVHHNGNTTSDYFGFNYKHSMEINGELYNRKKDRILESEGRIINGIIASQKKAKSKLLVDQKAIVNCDNPQKALFIRHGGLGDIIITLPIVNDFKSKNPECQIHYMCFKEFKDFLTQFSIIDAVIESDSMPNENSWVDLINQNSDFYHLYDYVIDWTYYPELSKDAETIDRMDIFAQKYGEINDVHFPEFKIKKTPTVNETINSIRSEIKVMIAPQATCSCRTWNWQNVKLFCKFLKGKYGSRMNIILVDKFRHDDMVDSNITNLCGRMNFEELIHLTSSVDALISTDTGLFHIAALLNKPCLGLFGSIPPDLRTKHYTNKMEFIYMKEFLRCIPCFDIGCNTVPCLNAIPNELIAEKLEKLIKDES